MDTILEPIHFDPHIDVYNAIMVQLVGHLLSTNLATIDNLKIFFGNAGMMSILFDQCKTIFIRYIIGKRADADNQMIVAKSHSDWPGGVKGQIKLKQREYSVGYLSMKQ